MSARSLVGIVGNPKPRSKTYAATQALTAMLAQTLQTDAPSVIDLADYGGRVLDNADAELSGVRERLTSSRILVVATPVYKGSYTGLLKAFFDGYGPGALERTFTIPLTIAASPQHSLASSTHLQPLLDELGAISPAGGIFLSDAVASDEMERDSRLASWVDRSAPLLATALSPMFDGAKR